MTSNTKHATTIHEFFELQDEYRKMAGINQSLLKKVIKNQDITKDEYKPAFNPGSVMELLIYYDVDDVREYLYDNGYILDSKLIPTGQYLQAIATANSPDSIVDSYRAISKSKISDEKLLENIDSYSVYIDKFFTGRVNLVMSHQDFDDLYHKAIAIKDTPEYELFIKGGKYQVVATRQFNGYILKGCIDVVGDDSVIDIKYTTIDNIFSLKRAIKDYRYELQLSFYKYLLEGDESVVGDIYKYFLFFIMKDKVTPVVMHITREDLTVGRIGLEATYENKYSSFFKKVVLGWEDALSYYSTMVANGFTKIEDIILKDNPILTSNIYGKTI